MGTECELTVVFPSGKSHLIEPTLQRAETALREVEVRMSTHIAAAELSRLNAARAGELVELSPATMEVLRTSRELATQTQGAFDVTCRPILQAWVRTRGTARLPTQEQLTEAKSQTGWEHFELVGSGVRKGIDGAGIDLGGITKGYAIDLAITAMMEAQGSGGLVNVGGDVRCFGARKDGGPWCIGIRNPFDNTLIGTLKIRDASVCTSGNYQRFIEIDGKRYSHIVDPRTALPAEMTPSVTTVAPTAAIADGWATALGVLGAEGLRLIPADSDIEAAIIIGTPQKYEIRVTEGFERFFDKRPEAKVTIHSPSNGPIATTQVKN